MSSLTASNSLSLYDTVIQKSFYINTDSAYLQRLKEWLTEEFLSCGIPYNVYYKACIHQICTWTCSLFASEEMASLSPITKIHKARTLVVAYMCIVDDACDQDKDVDNSLRNELCAHVNFLELYQGSKVNLVEAYETTNNPSIRLAIKMLQILEETLKEHKNEIDAIVLEMLHIFKAGTEVSDWWAKDHSPSLESYMKTREYDSFSRFLFTVGQCFTGSATLMSDDKSFIEESCKCCTIINDLCSYPKDLDCNMINNYIILVSNSENISIEESIAKASQQVTSLLNYLDKEKSKSINHENIYKVVVGYCYWCVSCERYFHHDHPIQELRRPKPASKSSSTSYSHFTYITEMKERMTERITV